MYAHSWILRNMDLKYLKYCSFLMFDSGHVEFALAIAIITLMYIATDCTGWF